jgi:hypothetical protein
MKAPDWLFQEKQEHSNYQPEISPVSSQNNQPLAFQPPTFFDALSQEKRKLNIKPPREKEEPKNPWSAYHTSCLDSDNEQGSFSETGHYFASLSDETCVCSMCGLSLLFVRSRKIFRNKGTS